MVLIEEQTGRQVSQALVGEARRGKELDAFYLAKMGSFAEGEEVKQLSYVVAPAYFG